MAKTSKISTGLSTGRRGFLKGAAAGAAALVGTSTAGAQQTGSQPRAAQPPSAAQRAVETGPPAAVEVQTTERPGSDYMVDVIKSLGIEYYAANPSSTLKSLHESLINYGGNQNPEFITCTHEEASVALANGYYKISGKLMLAGLHGTVGSQHAAMAVYNAYCDQAPVMVVMGNILDAGARRSYVDWLHSSQDVAAILREYTKWDDSPVSLSHFGESFVRAYKTAMTPPLMPVALVCDEPLQESPVPASFDRRIPKLPVISPPVADPNAIAQLAKMLVAAESPVLVASRCARTAAGLKSMVELAELLQAPVIDQHFRMNFPSRHALNFSDRARAAITNADLVLGLEVMDFYAVLHAYGRERDSNPRSILKSGAKVVTISALDLFTKSVYQNFQRFEDPDMALAADGEATLPFLIEEVKRQLTADRKRAVETRGAKYAQAWPKALEQARVDASYGWDASPISTSRLSMELWAQLKGEDWSLVNDTVFLQNWPLRLWDVNKHYQFIGGRGGEGLGYGPPAAVGAALANKKFGRLSVNIQGDGDFMYCPGAMWTAAHHKIPLLTVMHNNRAYNQEVMLVGRMASEHNRPVDRCTIGTTLVEPNIDYAKMAQGMGVNGEGPITDPKNLAPAIQRGIAAAKRGEPYLIDVVTQGR
ncbi:MAG TPA: thiamine pyrophosphate-dependent enzyme [Bryobacteraceae bacterium]|nr:thiamine pyrophosphate-dependent enzyme [Bryobacteraceae bacterium]